MPGLSDYLGELKSQDHKRDEASNGLLDGDSGPSKASSFG
jgi:hypothetical protein